MKERIGGHSFPAPERLGQTEHVSGLDSLALAELHSDVRDYLAEAGELRPTDLVDILTTDQVKRWRKCQRVPAEAYLHLHPRLRPEDPEAFELIYSEFLLREEAGEAPEVAEYRWRFPHHAERLDRQVALHQALRPALPVSRESEPTDDEEPLDDLETMVARVQPRKWPTIAGYRILDELGRGGMGVVYKARQKKLQRTVALKMIRLGSQPTDQELDRFRAEAEAVARLQHPNIVQIYEIGEQDGRPFFSLEYVEGGNLRERLTERPQPCRPAAELVELLARALHHAHEQGIIHRDLKPANILLRFTDLAGPPTNPAGWVLDLRTTIPKISDFGLAKTMEKQESETRTGDVLGTPAYMAPEQASGQVQSIGPATDVHALGVILYELVTGRRPFHAADTLETLLLVRFEDPVRPSSLLPRIPHDLETIILKCLEKEPAKRYSSALALAEDLKRFLSNEPIAARPPSLLYQCGKFARRNKALVGGLAGIAIALILGIIATSIAALGQAHQRSLADEAAARADDNALQAQAAQQAALREAYRARLGATLAALTNHDIPDALQHLEAAPRELRRWEWQYLHGRLDDSMAVIPSPRSGPWSWAFLTTGKQLAVAQKGPGYLLDALTGATLQQLPEGEAVLTAETLTGPLLFVDRSNGPLSLVDRDGKVRATFQTPGKSATRAVAVTPDGKRLIVLWSNEHSWRECCLFDLPSGKPAGQLTIPGGMVYALVISPDGKYLATAGDDRAVRLWETQSLAPRHECLGHTASVLCVAFSPDGRRIVSGSDDQTVRQWDVETGRLIDVHRGHSAGVNAVAYSPDGRWIVSGGREGNVRLWSTDGEEIAMVLHGHTAPIQRVAFSADGNSIVSADTGDPGTARIWDRATRNDVCVLRGHNNYVYPVACSPDNRWLASGGWDGNVRLWDAVTGEMIAVLGGKEMVRARNLTTGREVAVPRGHLQWIAALACTPDGKMLVSRGCDGTIRFWDALTGRLLAWVEHAGIGGAGDVHNLAISPDGRLLACILADRVRLWELAGLKELDPIPISTDSPRLVAFSPDSHRLAIGGRTPHFHILDIAERSITATIHGFKGELQALNFSPDGTEIVSAGSEPIVRIWNASTGKLRAELRGHAGEIFAAVYHPGGSRLATAGRDRSIRIWDTSSGEEVSRLSGHTAYVFSLAFGAGGATLVSGSGDFSVRLWDTFPLSVRLRARRDLQALRPEAVRLVDRLLSEHHDPDKVIHRIWSDPSYGEPLQRALWHEVLRRGKSAAE